MSRNLAFCCHKSLATLYTTHVVFFSWGVEFEAPRCQQELTWKKKGRKNRLAHFFLEHGWFRCCNVFLVLTGGKCIFLRHEISKKKKKNSHVPKEREREKKRIENCTLFLGNGLQRKTGGGGGEGGGGGGGGGGRGRGGGGGGGAGGGGGGGGAGGGGGRQNQSQWIKLQVIKSLVSTKE